MIDQTSPVTSSQSSSSISQSLPARSPAPDAESGTAFKTYQTLKRAPSFEMLFSPKIALLTAIVALLLGGIALLNRLPTRTITVEGTAREAFDVSRAEIVIVYLERGANKLALKSSGQTEFDRIMAQLNQHTGVTSLVKSNPLLTDVSAAGIAFEFREAASIKIQGLENIQQILAFIDTQSITISQAKYFPEESDALQKDLFQKAMDNAGAKGAQLAKTNHGHLGKVLAAVEVSSTTETGGGAQNQIEYNSSQVELQKVVRVTYKLKLLPI